MAEYVTDGVVYSMELPEGQVRAPDQPAHYKDLVATMAVFFPLAAVTTVIRIYTRSRISFKMGWDDYVMIAAFLFCASLNVDCLIMLKYGLGKHLWNVPLQPTLFPNNLLAGGIAELVYTLAMGCSKCSILLLYLRLFTTTGTRRIVWALMIFTISYQAAALFAILFSCYPVAASWTLELRLGGAHCVNVPAFYFSNTGLNIISDLAILIVPIPKLFSLKMAWRHRLAASLTLSLGGFVFIVSILRLPAVYKLLMNNDWTYYNIDNLMWCCLEVNISIICGSVAVLKPFIKLCFPGLMESTRHEAGYTTHGAAHHSGRFHRHSMRSRSLGDSAEYMFDRRSRFVSTVEALDSGRQDGSMGENGIIKTIDYQIAYAKAGSRRSSLRPPSISNC